MHAQQRFRLRARAASALLALLLAGASAAEEPAAGKTSLFRDPEDGGYRRAGEGQAARSIRKGCARVNERCAGRDRLTRPEAG